MSITDRKVQTSPRMARVFVKALLGEEWVTPQGTPAHTYFATLDLEGAHEAYEQLVNLLLTLPRLKPVGFSGYACGNPLRYRLKAVPPPVQEKPWCCWTPSVGTSNILPGEGFLSRTSRIFGCQRSQVDLSRSGAATGRNPIQRMYILPQDGTQRAAIHPIPGGDRMRDLLERLGEDGTPA